MIPRIIHQMWIGDAEKRPTELMETWRAKNPRCAYILWTEKELSGLKFRAQHLIDQMPELNGKCNIMRYEILYKYGGFFIDADSECINELDDFFFDDDHDRFTCWENEKKTNLVATGFMACRKGDKLFKKFTDVLLKINNVDGESWRVCGQKLFTDVVNKWADTYPMNIYPSWYFLPEHGTGETYKGSDKIYCRHYWGSTFHTYGERINDRRKREKDVKNREMQQQNIQQSQK